MRKEFEIPEMDIIEMEQEDIIVSSPGDENETDEMPFSGNNG